MALKPAVFLDKDGTVLLDVPYNCDPDKMAYAPGAEAGLALLARLQLPLFVVSNQPGVALRKFDVEALHGVGKRLKQMFDAVGAKLAGFYYCPHHPDGRLASYTGRCSCRKPAPGMLLDAAREHRIDLSRSWLVGDILDDVEAACRAGCRAVLIDNGNETEWVINPWRRPDYQATDFLDAARYVVQHMPHDDRVVT